MGNRERVPAIPALKCSIVFLQLNGASQPELTRVLLSVTRKTFFLFLPAVPLFV